MIEVEFKLLKTRGFEVVTGYEDKNINLPIQMTKKAAGYDFEAAEDVTIPSIFTQLTRLVTTRLKTKEFPILEEWFKPTLVETGIRAYMPDDEFLALYNRSSNPFKRFLLMVNGVAVIDSDYYSKEKGAGHIRFQFINFGLTAKKIKKGERIGQGVFQKFLKADKGAAREWRKKSWRCRFYGYERG